MQRIFLYILFFVKYSINIISAQHSTTELVNFTQNCRRQLTVKQIQFAVENVLRNLATSTKEINNSVPPKVCQDATKNGSYQVQINGRLVQVYCEVNFDDKWLVIQRRINGSVDFYRNWTEYQQGFGNINGEFWLGLDILHYITRSKSYELRVDLRNWKGNTAYASYKNFKIGNSESNYQLTVDSYSGTGGNALSYHNKQPFTTKDRDNDEWSDGNCAVLRFGAWWYKRCYRSNLNGKYYRDGRFELDGIYWKDWRSNRLKTVKMKIRQNVIH